MASQSPPRVLFMDSTHLSDPTPPCPPDRHAILPAYGREEANQEAQAVNNRATAAGAKDTRRRQHQSGLRALQFDGQERPGHDRGVDCRRDQSRQTPGNSGTALAALIDGCPVGTTVEICWEADHPELVGLPFEATSLPDGRILALQPAVVTMRRPLGLSSAQRSKRRRHDPEKLQTSRTRSSAKSIPQ
jgi:hypothetical protein